MPLTETVAFLGVGNIGAGICRNIILKKDDIARPVKLWNRTSDKAKQFVSGLPAAAPNTQASDKLRDAITDATIVFWCLSDDQAEVSLVDQLLDIGDGIIKDKLFVDCSTVHPDTTDKTQQRLEAAGAHFVAMPVFGAPAMAEAGQLIPVLAGPAALLDRVRPFTVGVTAKALIDMPNEPSSKASKLKLTGNTMIMNMVESTAQGHALAEANGIGPKELHRFIDLMWGGAYSAYSNRMLSGDYHKRESPLFAVDLAIKDVNHARSLAPHAELPGLDAALRHLQAVKQEQQEKGDVAGIYGAVRQASGMSFKNE